jgi:uncharacterized protein (DUF58 family)
VPRKCLWRGVLILVLCVVLAIPVKASGYPSGGGIVAGVVAGLAALVVVTVVVIHRSSPKRTITGCVSSGENGMSVTDEKDKKIYALSGNTASIKSGDRVTLQGKKVKSKDAKTALAWEATKETKDFGACQL